MTASQQVTRKKDALPTTSAMPTTAGAGSGPKTQLKALAAQGFAAQEALLTPVQQSSGAAPRTDGAQRGAPVQKEDASPAQPPIAPAAAEKKADAGLLDAGVLASLVGDDSGEKAQDGGTGAVPGLEEAKLEALAIVDQQEDEEAPAEFGMGLPDNAHAEEGDHDSLQQRVLNALMRTRLGRAALEKVASIVLSHHR